MPVLMRFKSASCRPEVCPYMLQQRDRLIAELSKAKTIRELRSVGNQLKYLRQDAQVVVNPAEGVSASPAH